MDLTAADKLTVARAASVPLVVVLYAWSFPNHDYWATAVFCVAMATDWFDGQLARRQGHTSSVGSLLDPIADKILVLAALVMLIEQGVAPAWMVAAIVVREVLITGLRQAAIERGVVSRRDPGKPEDVGPGRRRSRRWAPAAGARITARRGGARRRRPPAVPGLTTPAAPRGCSAALRPNSVTVRPRCRESRTTRRTGPTARYSRIA